MNDGYKSIVARYRPFFKKILLGANPCNLCTFVNGQFFYYFIFYFFLGYRITMADKPKRPLSAYMLWLNSAREGIKKENPGIKVTEIAKKGGEIWRGMKDKSVSVNFLKILTNPSKILIFLEQH